jgi:hypothetical protein
MHIEKQKRLNFLYFFFRTLLGSVSDHIVHNCPCTVIITKPQEAQHAEERRKSIQSLTGNTHSTK